MKNNQPLEHLEAFDDYPEGFQSNIKTQRKLIEDAVKDSAVDKNSTPFYTSMFLRVAGVFLLFFGGWWVWLNFLSPDFKSVRQQNDFAGERVQTENDKSQDSSETQTIPENQTILNNPTTNHSPNSQAGLYNSGNNPNVVQYNSHSVSTTATHYKPVTILHPPKTSPKIDETLNLATNDRSQAVVSSQETDRGSNQIHNNPIEPGKTFFAKRQRIKQYEFVAEKPAQSPVVPQPKYEFLVFRDGGLKWLSKTQNKLEITRFPMND
jgi:hypothetical protein